MKKSPLFGEIGVLLTPTPLTNYPSTSTQPILITLVINILSRQLEVSLHQRPAAASSWLPPASRGRSPRQCYQWGVATTDRGGSARPWRNETWSGPGGEATGGTRKNGGIWRTGHIWKKIDFPSDSEIEKWIQLWFDSAHLKENNDFTPCGFDESTLGLNQQKVRNKQVKLESVQCTCTKWSYNNLNLSLNHI